MTDLLSFIDSLDESHSLMVFGDQITSQMTRKIGNYFGIDYDQFDYVVTDPVQRAKANVPAYEDTKHVTFTQRINPKIQGVFT